VNPARSGARLASKGERSPLQFFPNDPKPPFSLAGSRLPIRRKTSAIGATGEPELLVKNTFSALASRVLNTSPNGRTTQEVTMPATLSPSRKTAFKTRSTRPVPELLLELAYRLHAHRVVARPDHSPSVATPCGKQQ
jgi:hypothetical protein